LIVLSNTLASDPNGDNQINAFKSYIAQQNLTPDDQGAQNVEWFLSQFVLPQIEGRSAGYDERSTLATITHLIARLRQRTGNTLSVWEKAVLAWGYNGWGRYLSLALGSLYCISRLLLIILSFTSFRAMPDSVYDTTWAKNIPSVQ
jgi:hypothetical protein